MSDSEKFGSVEADHTEEDGMQSKEISTSTDIDTASISFPCRHTSLVGNRGRLEDETEGSQADSWSLRDSNSLTISDPASFWDTADQYAGLTEVSVLQAVVFIEDAYMYRSINHNVLREHLRIYRRYQSTPVIVFRYFVIFLLHMLAFVEYPSSLSVTSDLRQKVERVDFPCWLTQSCELICLLLLMVDNILRVYLNGFYYFIRHKWDMGAMLIITVSLIDWAVSFGLGCQEFVRFRRILRPYFILQYSSLMKKIVNCLRMTLPEVMSVLLLLALHLFVFTLFGMLLFPEFRAPNINETLSESSNWTTVIPPTPASGDEGAQYFHSLLDSFISLLVLLTTANNPDVTMPAYSRNRFASLFFVLYLLIGLYCFMNMLLAVIYNQFRGYFLSSMQSSLLRRRLGVRAAFEVLRRKQSRILNGQYSPHFVGVGVGGAVVKTIIDQCLLPKHVKSTLLEAFNGREENLFTAGQFQELFSCMDADVVHKQRPAVRWFGNPKLRFIQRIFIHKYFTYFGMLMALVNLIIITVQLGAKYDSSFRESHSTLRICNFSFVIYYCVEQVLKVWAFGWRRYLSDKGNLFDAVITLALIIGEIVSASLYGIPYFPKSKEIIVSSSSSTMWSILRMVNILIMVRMFKIIPHVRSMSLVATVLMDLMKNMKSFAGILIVIFYAFAIIGMELFHGTIEYKPEYVNKTFACGTYEQLDYWANNFDDFFASLIVLWDIMIVNNWHVFLEVFRNRTSPWSYLFFVAWWLMSVIIVLNLFTALIMENFIMKWDRRHQISNAVTSSSSAYEGLTVSVHLNNVHSMFRDMLQEPAENELLMLLSKHRYLQLGRD